MPTMNESIMGQHIKILTAANKELLARLDSERRLFAAMALQGLLSATKENGDWSGIDCGAAEQAVIEADKLIEELNKVNTE